MGWSWVASVVVVVAVLGSWVSTISAQRSNCHRSPLRTEAPKTPGDNDFKIKISGNPQKYVPGEVYTVSVQGWRTQYSVQKFTGFLLVVEASQSPVNIFGPQSVGTFQLYGDALTMHSDDCPNAVTQTSSIPKSEIQILWTAPPAGSGCVRFRATVVENRDVWYMDDGELTKELCEEVQESDDMQPEVIYDCCACDEAKYEVTFEGLWSRHTHPKDFPTNEWLTHFSDIIGASHSADYHVWKYGDYASDGLHQVAEWGSTRMLESELKSQSDHIRTIIKARGLWYPNVNGKTFAVFRVDNRHHLMSLVSMLGPSPDWIVGVSDLELCLKNCSWVDQKTLNLYPWDAGTDSGVTYESANAPSIPREKIRRITNSYPNDPKSPFYDPTGMPMTPLAKLTITRQRVYEKACSETRPVGLDDPDLIYSDDIDSNRPDCQVGGWSEFTPCSVSCGKGLRMRTRSYLMPLKADMGGCKRQLEEKEMCAAAQIYCEGGGAFAFSDDRLQLQVPNFDRICATSDWSQWTPCSETCGKGHRMRNRRFLHRMGRKKCDKALVDKEMCVADIMECVGQPENIPPECAVTQWTDFSPCSASCGQGFTMRARSFLIPSTNKDMCSVSTIEKKLCMAERPNCTISPEDAKEVCMMDKEIGPCRAFITSWYYDSSRQMCLPFQYSGCRGNRNRFNNYEECTRVCEMNRHTRGSQDFLGGPLNSHNPPRISLYAPSNVENLRLEKVNCMVTPWGEWSPCSVTCGRGRIEKRRMIKVEPQNGGRRCPRKLVRKKKCKNSSCNDGYNGLESLSLRRDPPPPPFQPYQATGELTYLPDEEYIAPALFNPPFPLPGARDEGAYDTVDVSAPAPAPPADYNYDDGSLVDCVMGEWGPWSPCTHSCGPEALQQRSRNVIVEPRHGGAVCGDRYERRYCTLPPCPHSRTESWDYRFTNNWMRYR